MMDVTPQVDICLRLVDDDLCPNFVSQLLCIQPDRSYKKGDLQPPERNGRKTRVATHGLWMINGDLVGNRTFEDAVLSLLSRLTDSMDAWNEIASFQQVEIFCGWFLDGQNSGLNLSPLVLYELSRRQISIDICLYP